MAGSNSYELTEYISPDGKTYNFTSGSRFLMSESGWGFPEIKYITQQGPFQHGQTYLGYRLQPRMIQIQHRVNGCSRDNYWLHRRELINMLRPNRQALGEFEPGKIVRTYADGSQRAIDVFVDKGPIFGERSLDQWDEWSFNQLIRFVAPDPTFYDPVQKSATAAYTTADHLVFHNSVTGASATDLVFFDTVSSASQRGLVFQAGMIETTINCTNAGDWIVFPAITITGPMNGAYIYNRGTGEVLRVKLQYLNRRDGDL